MEVIEALRNEGFDLWCDDENIHCRLRDGVKPDRAKATELLTTLKKHKAEAIRFLKACNDQHVKENVHPGPDMRTITVFSKVLNREAFVSWQGDNPERILFDGIPYSVAEIEKLKAMPLTPDDLQTIHRIKRKFGGEIE